MLAFENPELFFIFILQWGAIFLALMFFSDKQHDLQEQINNLNDSLREKLEKIKKTTLYNTADLLRGLPNMYKDDLEFYKKVNGYDSYYLDIDSIKENRIIVVFRRETANIDVNSSKTYTISEVLNKVEEYKQVKEKCCPKKGKK